MPGSRADRSLSMLLLHQQKAVIAVLKAGWICCTALGHVMPEALVAEQDHGRRIVRPAQIAGVDVRRLNCMQVQSDHSKVHSC